MQSQSYMERVSSKIERVSDGDSRIDEFLARLFLVTSPSIAEGILDTILEHKKK